MKHHCSFQKCKSQAIYKSEDTRKFYCRLHAADYFRRSKSLAFLPSIEE